MAAVYSTFTHAVSSPGVERVRKEGASFAGKKSHNTLRTTSNLRMDGYVGTRQTFTDSTRPPLTDTFLHDLTSVALGFQLIKRQNVPQRKVTFTCS